MVLRTSIQRAGGGLYKSITLDAVVSCVVRDCALGSRSVPLMQELLDWGAVVSGCGGYFLAQFPEGYSEIDRLFEQNLEADAMEVDNEEKAVKFLALCVE